MSATTASPRAVQSAQKIALLRKKNELADTIESPLSTPPRSAWTLPAHEVQKLPDSNGSHAGRHGRRACHLADMIGTVEQIG